MAKKAQKEQLFISQKEFAKRLKITQSAVNKAAKAGRIKTKKQGQSVLIEYHSQRKAFLDSTTKSSVVRRATGKTAGGASGDMYDAKLSLEQAKSKMALLELQSKQGLLLNADEVKQTWLNIAQNVKKNLLAIPKRIEALLAAETVPHKCGRILGEEIKRTLLELGNT